MRAIGLGVSSTFAEIAYLEDGIVRSGGKVDLRRESLQRLAFDLRTTDEGSA